MPDYSSLADRLRQYIVGEMHIDHLSPGDRLPTYRALSRAWQVDHRAVARAYRRLEEQGLVEIRERQGVFLREQEKIGGELPTETAQWVADEVLTEAWRRRMKIPELPEFMRRCTASVKLRCAVVESTEDHLQLLCGELSEWFGFDAHPFAADRLPLRVTADEVPLVDLQRIPNELREADLLVSTLFHAAEVRAVAEALEMPFAAVRMHPGAAQAIEQHLRYDDLTVVCLDPSLGERVRRAFGTGTDRQIHTVLVSDSAALSQIQQEEPVLVTSPAAERAGRHFASVTGSTPTFDPDSTRELARLLIRLNLEARAAGKAAPDR